MIRRIWLTFLRVYPGLALIASAAGVGYAIGRIDGYVQRANEEFRWHTMWEAQQ